MTKDQDGLVPQIGEREGVSEGNGGGSKRTFDSDSVLHVLHLPLGPVVPGCCYVHTCSPGPCLLHCNGRHCVTLTRLSVDKSGPKKIQRKWMRLEPGLCTHNATECTGKRQRGCWEGKGRGGVRWGGRGQCVQYVTLFFNNLFQRSYQFICHCYATHMNMNRQLMREYSYKQGRRLCRNKKLIL